MNRAPFASLSHRYRLLQARRAREPHLAVQAWHEDPETAQLVLDVFASFAHQWIRAQGSTEAVALCTGFRHRGELAPESDRPACAGCARRRGEYRGHQPASPHPTHDLTRTALDAKRPADVERQLQLAIEPGRSP